MSKQVIYKCDRCGKEEEAIAYKDMKMCGISLDLKGFETQRIISAEVCADCFAELKILLKKQLPGCEELT